QVNRAFVEAFLLGANHELAGELRWREFPTDLRGSYFRNFWDKTIHSLDAAEREKFKRSAHGKNFLTYFGEANLGAGQSFGSDGQRWAFVFDTYATASPNEQQLVLIDAYEEAVENWLLTREEDKDVRPFHQWAEDRLLGTNHRDQSTNAQLVLLIRAMLFQKFPNLLIYLYPKGNGTPSFADGERKYPVFEGQLPPEIEFLGFPPVADPRQYYLVFEERVGLQRYGLDANKENELDATDARDLDDLSWGHFNTVPGAYLNDDQPTDNAASGRWDNAAFIAKAFTQQPIRYVVELDQFIHLT
ncbi:MAG: hypothetical protein AAFN92_17160, partial [Bacteroidota bacterium]